MREFMPLLYPKVSIGGFLDDQLFDRKVNRICPENQAQQSSTPLVDALLVHLIEQNVIDLETVQGFSKGWMETAGQRQMDLDRAKRDNASCVEEEDTWVNILDGPTTTDEHTGQSSENHVLIPLQSCSPATKTR